MLMQICALFYLMPFLTAQKFSPCLSIFAYEPRGPEPDQWYGSITLSNPEELRGIWLRIQLDEPAELLGNWFGETSSDDNREFLIINKNYHYRPNSGPLSIRFFVKFNTSKNTPSLSGINLNGRQVCTSYVEITSSTTPRLFISQTQATTHRQISSNNPIDLRHHPISNTQRTTARTTTTIERVNDELILDRRLPSPQLVASRFSSDNYYERPEHSIPKHNRNQITCGTTISKALPLITNGETTLENEWPWHAALYRYEGINIKYICGGSLISRSHVLTAANCVRNPKAGAAIRPEMYVVYLGKYNLIQSRTQEQNFNVERIVVHPEYNATYYRNDIAMLKLEKDVEITNSVRPICLWEGDESLKSILNDLGTIVGWGFDQTGHASQTLMQAKMPVVTEETCIRSNIDFLSLVSAKTYCAGFRNGTSACIGDSGGGMAFPKPGTHGSNTVWQIRGIVAVGKSLPQNNKRVCDTTAYIIFTDVAKHLDWIKTIIQLS